MSSATRSTSSQSSRRPTENHSKYVGGTIAVVLVLLVFYFVASRQTKEQIIDNYGKRRGIDGGQSVNSTAVFAEMFKQRGSRVTSWSRMSPRLKRADTIVWVPDNFSPPNEEHCDWIRQWMDEDISRTLIYVGRDFDAEIAYWETVRESAPPGQVSEVMRRTATAKMQFDTERTGLEKSESSGWFSVHRDRPQGRVIEFDGVWADEFDEKKTGIVLGERYEEVEAGEYSNLKTTVLLSGRRGPESEQLEPIVIEHEDINNWSRILVVTNGSFLLNMPLVNHEHRKMAGLLIDQCDSIEDVVFLESDASGPKVVDSEASDRPPNALDMLLTWPVSAIFPHVMIFGLLLCLAFFPIFGRPGELPRKKRSDFAHHIYALAKLLVKTQDFVFARSRISHYEDRVKRDSGTSHTRRLGLDKILGSPRSQDAAPSRTTEESTTQEEQEETEE